MIQTTKTIKTSKTNERSRKFWLNVAGDRQLVWNYLFIYVLVFQVFILNPNKLLTYI